MGVSATRRAQGARARAGVEADARVTREQKRLRELALAFWPLKYTLPCTLKDRGKLAKIDSSVVLPAPLEPSSASVPPGLTTPDTSERISLPLGSVAVSSLKLSVMGVTPSGEESMDDAGWTCCGCAVGGIGKSSPSAMPSRFGFSGVRLALRRFGRLFGSFLRVSVVTRACARTMKR